MAVNKQTHKKNISLEEAKRIALEYLAYVIQPLDILLTSKHTAQLNALKLQKLFCSMAITLKSSNDVILHHF